MQQIKQRPLKEVIRDAVDIVEIASRYLNIKRTGRSYQALCPFHTEKTPSFSLDPERQTYYCFGCGSKGDVFSLLMKMEGITFPEAISKLKNELGMSEKELKKITPVREKVQKSDKLDDAILHEISCDLQSALDLTSEHYNHLLFDRHMNDDMIITNSYRSFPEKPWSPFAKMKKRDYTGFPGAYLADGKNGSSYWLLNNMGKGILIPFRNQYNYIVGWQIRLDEPRPELYALSKFKEFKAHQAKDGIVKITWNGEIISDLNLQVGESKKIISKSSIELGEVGLKKGNKYLWLTSSDKKNGTGAGEPTPVHIAVPSHTRKKWRPGQLIQTPVAGVTEGPIKADISAEKLKIPFVSVPGINQCMAAVEVLIEMGVKKVILGFDMDIARKIQLLEQIRELKLRLEKVETFVLCEVLVWNEHKHGKGLDDCLNNNFMPQKEILFNKKGGMI